MSDVPKITVDEKKEESSSTKEAPNIHLISWFKTTFPKRPYTVLGALCGLICALLIFAIGFWHTAFIALCVAVGVAFGQYADGNPKLIRLIKRIMSDTRN